MLQLKVYICCRMSSNRIRIQKAHLKSKYALYELQWFIVHINRFLLVKQRPSLISMISESKTFKVNLIVTPDRFNPLSASVALI